jgi:nucleotide-binding universal stress UspA family protein
MKILVAYDGSSFADAAIDDLQWAGLSQDADAIVLSAVESLEAEIKAEERFAEKGRDRLQKHFPEWKIQAISSPAPHASTAILDKAADWSADLIVAGTQGRSGLARVLLGSVSLKLVHQATCSVRIARARQPGLPIRLVIGDDGSPEAEAAVAEVSRRTWPAGTEVRVVAVRQFLLPVETANVPMDPALYAKINEDEHVRLKSVIQRASEQLDAPGLTVQPMLDEGDPKEMLLKEARNWNASAIFVGSRGMGRLERILLGSVSSAAVSHAPCTVEVVRNR